MKEYKDALGNPLKIKFVRGGFSNDITVCQIWKQVHMPKFLKKTNMGWVKVHSDVSGQKIAEVAQWTDEDFHEFALKTIDNYNREKMAKEIVTAKMNSLNQI